LVPDPSRREELLISLGRRFDDSLQRNVGEIGEDVVVDAAREELAALGHTDLVRDVRRVSLLSDQLGYDVSAPRVGGGPRLLEVKSTTGDELKNAWSVHLSRNEADVGAAFPEWALVICVVTSVEQRAGSVVGWCPRGELDDLLPSDGPSGRWEQALVEIPAALLSGGLPSPVA
jgi:hypothetical protein